MKQILFCVLLLLLFAACSPRIGTTITKTYPSLNADSPVAVYLYQTEVPSETESLGRVTISDTGFTVTCDSLTVVNLLKDEARKTGGNAVCITDHKKPSIWGSSCHQMTAIILRVPDFDMVSSDSSLFANNQVKPERKLSQITLSASLGYGRRTARMASNLSSFDRAYMKGLMSGLVYDASFNYYFNDNYGLGLLYSAHNADQNMYGQDINTGEEGEFKTNNLIYFIGPAFLMRLPVAEKWILDMGLGLGYLGYLSNADFATKKGKLYGSTFGSYFAIGTEYKLEKNWALGLRLASVSGGLTRWTREENGRKKIFKVDEGGEGLQHLQILLGLRYYIK